MKHGDQIRLRGPAGAPFVVTVGPAFEADYIKKMLRTGEWTRLEAEGQDQEPKGDGPPAGGTPPADGDDQAAAASAPSSPPASDPTPAPTPAPAPAPAGKATDPDRPAVNATKAEWIAYVARTRHMSREDAAAYTKADLIDMVS